MKRKSARRTSRSLCKPEIEGRVERMIGVFMPSRIAGARWQRHDQPRRQGCHRARADRQRREVGTRTGQGHPFVAQGHAWTVPAWHLVRRSTRWSRMTATRPAMDSYLVHVPPISAEDKAMIAAAAARAAKRNLKSSSACRTGSTTCPVLRPTNAWSRSQPSISKVLSVATRVRGERPCCRTRPWPSSICAWFPA